MNRTIVVLGYDTWETVWAGTPYVMEITEAEYDDLIADNCDASELSGRPSVSLVELIECWNTHSPTRKLPTAAE